MKKQTKRLSISLWLFKNGRLVHKSTFYKKSHLLRCIQGKSWKFGVLKFNYGNGYCNECLFYSFEDTCAAVKIFTERSIFEYIKTKERR